VIGQRLASMLAHSGVIRKQAIHDRVDAMHRREFLCSTGAALAGVAMRAGAQRQVVELRIDASHELATMPGNYLGLSYESSQLTDPAFFSAENTALVRAFRDLTPNVVLRLGGKLSDVTLWKGSAAI
jgi:hypothetical protein